jgi:uncharacterized damage-inducible protein DinB
MFSIKQQLLEYAQYNLWANRQLTGLFATLDDTLVNQEIVSSFPSIRKTLMHLWDVETLWLKRLQAEAATDFPSKNFDGDNATLYQHLIDISTEFARFVAAQPETYFVSPLGFSFLATPEKRDEQLPKDMIHHCLNHQTMHRGQLITMARQLGVTQFPRTDYIIWVRDERGKSL